MFRLTTICLFMSLIPTTHAAAQQSSPYCQADFDFNNRLDFFDVSAFLEAFQDGNLAADFNGSGHLNFFDVSAFLNQITGDCPDLTDTDGDRLPDFVETNNGIFVDEFATGSDPFNSDTDNDGLPDGDEVLGTVQGLTLPLATPVYRDLYIECDWFAGNFQGRNENYRPTAAVENRVVECFQNAGSPNPYGAPDGINIHLDYGQGSGFSGGNQLPGSPDFIAFDDDFNAYKAEHFDPKRKGYYHYAIFTNRYNSASNRSSGVAEINGDDFIVSMVDYNSTNNMSNTLVHELGHNLGLRHGGFENRNRKPNYNSVMNYRHQFPGVDFTGDARGDGLLDYSRGVNIDLNENALIETLGVTGFTPIDWNRNGVIQTAAYSGNINCDSVFTIQECGLGSGCYDSSCDVLEDHNDWLNINWDRLNQSSDRARELVQSECENWPGK